MLSSAFHPTRTFSLQMCQYLKKGRINKLFIGKRFNAKIFSYTKDIDETEVFLLYVL